MGRPTFHEPSDNRVNRNKAYISYIYPLYPMYIIINQPSTSLIAPFPQVLFLSPMLSTGFMKKTTFYLECAL